MRSEATLDTVSRTADRWSDIADLVGRIALASLFLMSGVDKLFIHTAENIQLMQAYRVPLAGLLVYPSGVFELAAGLALAAGYRARLAALLLALFTAFVSPIFHAFWSAPPDQALVQMLFFTTNVAIFGGLLHLAWRGEDWHGSGNNSTTATALDENGQRVNDRTMKPPKHDILTGSRPDGTAFGGGDLQDMTCGNWTKDTSDGSAMVGHHDRIGPIDHPWATSWNSSHNSRGCSQERLRSSGGEGLFYCFAVNK